MKAKKGDIVHKLKIARGQLDGILQMVEENRYCVDISNQLLATQALLKSANQQILQAHIRSCVRDALQTDAVNPKLEEALKLHALHHAPAAYVQTRYYPTVWHPKDPLIIIGRNSDKCGELWTKS